MMKYWLFQNMINLIKYGANLWSHIDEKLRISTNMWDQGISNVIDGYVALRVTLM